MSMLKTAMAGAIGFAVGASAMLLPGNQKMKRQAQKQVDKLINMSKMWYCRRRARRGENSPPFPAF